MTIILLYIILIFYKWTRDLSTIDFSHYNPRLFNFFVLIFAILFLLSLPWYIKYYINKKYSKIKIDLNNSINELEEEI